MELLARLLNVSPCDGTGHISGLVSDPGGPVYELAAMLEGIGIKLSAIGAHAYSAGRQAAYAECKAAATAAKKREARLRQRIVALEVASRRSASSDLNGGGGMSVLDDFRTLLEFSGKDKHGDHAEAWLAQDGEGRLIVGAADAFTSHDFVLSAEQEAAVLKLLQSRAGG